MPSDEYDQGYDDEYSNYDPRAQYYARPQRQPVQVCLLLLFPLSLLVFHFFRKQISTFRNFFELLPPIRNLLFHL
jgi:hypothetical protein